MREYKKSIALLMAAILLLSVAGCAAAGADSGTNGLNAGAAQTTAPTVPADSFDYAKYRTTKEEVEAQHEQYGKGFGLDISEFKYGNICIIVYPFALDYGYRASDFEGIECESVTVTEHYPDGHYYKKGMPTKLVRLRLADKTRQGMFDAVNILMQREDVYDVVLEYYQTSLEPNITRIYELSEEAKQEISAAWLVANSVELDWDAKNNMGESCLLYLGSYNGKYALATIGDCPNVAVDFTYVIGPYTLINNCPFDIIVCVDGELATLSVAYEQDLLTADETMSIVMYLTNFFSFDE